MPDTKRAEIVAIVESTKQDIVLVGARSAVRMTRLFGPMIILIDAGHESETSPVSVQYSQPRCVIVHRVRGQGFRLGAAPLVGKLAPLFVFGT